MIKLYKSICRHKKNPIQQAVWIDVRNIDKITLNQSEEQAAVMLISFKDRSNTVFMYFDSLRKGEAFVKKMLLDRMLLGVL